MSSKKSDTELRAVYVEVEPTRQTSTPLRPFHHARVVVTDPGQHKRGEDLTERSTGMVYDRGDGVVIGTTQKNKDLDIVAPKPYSGIPDNWKSNYRGFTDKSPEEIQKISDNLVQSQIDNGVKYSIPYNNCAHFATTFADKITEGAQYNTIAGTEALARGDTEEAKRLVKTASWSEDVGNRVDAGFTEYRDQWQPDWSYGFHERGTF
ncbi:unnamed protein product [Clonostachys rhizophaga]|uniref:PPPDE domain-containing protein n=1 Tax=Clonostachys rhizophaga TaxID=160324 RepID=A0A9N9VR14_9HYPO|nr:unnamed protein product [Clonostachys rhizophaga]